MFHGSLVALVTPMQIDGAIDFTALRKLVEWHLDNHTDGFVVIGTTGEAATLSTEEKSAIIKTVIEIAEKKVPIIAGTGTNSTTKTIELTRNAMELGVDACLLVTPYYNRPSQTGLYQHYKTVAENVPIPQILYNIPKRTGCDLLPETVAKLAIIPNIIGIKEGMPDRAKQIIAECGNSMDVFSGDDDTALEIMLAGGKGVISTTANVAPHAMHNLCEAALNHQVTQAEKINLQLTPLFKALFVESNPIPLKWALLQMDMIPSGIRLPLTPLAENHHQTVRHALESAGINLQQ